MSNETLEKIAALEQQLEELRANTDVFWVLSMGVICFFLQAGFALVECGSVRAKNTTNILVKNILDVFVAGFAYWAIGYAFAFGNEGNAFISWRYFFHESLPLDQHHIWFFHYVFSATAATIVSGAVAERCQFGAYLIYSFFLTGFIYPVIAHWNWHPKGWLYGKPQDFAGGIAVHHTGGMAALMGAIALGPRLGRFHPDTGKPKRISGHSVPLAAMGAFILFFGFFAFNGASGGTIVGSKEAGSTVAIVMINTVLAGTGGAFTLLLIKKWKEGYWTLLATINGSLAGMVSSCSGCNILYGWGAFVTGIMGGLVYYLIDNILLRLRIDDPLNAFAVHSGGGVTGLICANLLGRGGIFLTGFTDKQAWVTFGWSMVEVAAVTGWVGALCGLVFYTLKYLNLLRVSEELELKGLDIPKHGEPAYPDDAYSHGWGNFYTHDLEGGQALKELFKRMFEQLDNPNGEVIGNDNTPGPMNYTNDTGVTKSRESGVKSVPVMRTFSRDQRARN